MNDKEEEKIKPIIMAFGKVGGGVIQPGDPVDYSVDDDIPIGTPIYSSPAGGGMVKLPVKKELVLQFEQKITELKSQITYYEHRVEELIPLLKRKYRKMIKKGFL